MSSGKFEAVVRQLTELIPERLTALRDYIVAVSDGRNDLLETAISTAHQLRGSSGTLGLHAVGLKCGEIEDSLKAISNANVGMTSEQAHALTEIVSQAMQITMTHLANEEVQQEEDPLDPQTGDARNDSADSPPSVSTPLDSSGQDLSNLLLVDDDPLFCEYVIRIGRQRLINVVCAGSSAEAIKLSKEKIFDGILVDLHLWKGLDSFELATILRESGTPLAFISANAQPAERVAAAQAGAILFLDKPLEPEIIESAVQQMRAVSMRLRPKVLLIEDDPLFAVIIREMLHRNGIELIHATDGLNVLNLLQDYHPDLILLDADLPTLNGYELCTLVRSNPHWASLPIIFVTAKIDHQSRIAAFRTGADDYISKPLVEEELIAKVAGRIERANLMREKTTKDTVTGVLMRNAFLERLRGMFNRTNGTSSKVFLAMIDLDTFKKVNDVGGHLIGDSVLASLGRLMNSSFGNNAIRGRWGGDEFILAFEGTGKPDAAKMVEELLDSLMAIEFHGEHNEPFNMSFSAGIAQYPDEGTAVYDLVKVADSRLYSAKRQGRARVVCE